MVAVSRGVKVAILLLALAALASAQITFSRDWTGGKRSPGPQLAVDCGQFARLCRHFIHEMKAEMTANVPNPASVKRRRPMEDPPNYEDE